jgi:uncharacterized protein YjiS (DUF1127 family)
MLPRDTESLSRSFRKESLPEVDRESALHGARWQYLCRLGRDLIARGLLGSYRALVGLVRAIGVAVLKPVQRRLRCRAGARRMMDLDDHLLKDIGIRRGEIRAAAYGLLKVRGALDPPPEPPVRPPPGAPCARPLAAESRERAELVEAAPGRFLQRPDDERPGAPRRY